ncbi:MAG: hypothetical protein LC790_11240, partial [Actinobacteria bacterium]|nr:hypothetical protein [Actinomycetota bacterium]
YSDNRPVPDRPLGPGGYLDEVRSGDLRAYLDRRVYVNLGELFGVGGEPAEGVVDGTFNWACL